MNEQKKEKIYNFVVKNEWKIILAVGIVAFAIYYCQYDSAINYRPINLRRLRLLLNSTNSSLILSLQKAASIYTAQQKVPPKVFSDFVTMKTKAEGQHTMTLYICKPYIKNVQGMKTDKMSITFKKEDVGKNDPLCYSYGVTSIYYLNGTDITADYKDFEY